MGLSASAQPLAGHSADQASSFGPLVVVGRQLAKPVALAFAARIDVGLCSEGEALKWQAIS
jgi:hypothetical protein